MRYNTYLTRDARGRYLTRRSVPRDQLTIVGEHEPRGEHDEPTCAGCGQWRRERIPGVDLEVS